MRNAKEGEDGKMKAVFTDVNGEAVIVFPEATDGGALSRETGAFNWPDRGVELGEAMPTEAGDDPAGGDPGDEEEPDVDEEELGIRIERHGGDFGGRSRWVFMDSKSF